MRLQRFLSVLSRWLVPSSLALTLAAASSAASLPQSRPDADAIVKIFTGSNPAVTTEFTDAAPAQPWVADLLGGVRPQVVSSLHFGAGYYRIRLESYCLHAGKHAPGAGDGYALAPLKGAAANLIADILRRSAAFPRVPQSDIQRLLWGIEAHMKFSDFDPQIQARLAPMLTPADVASIDAFAAVQNVRSQAEAFGHTLLGRLLPQASKALSLAQTITSELASSRTPYGDLARQLAPPGGSGSGVQLGMWYLSPQHVLVRYFPSAYTRVVLEVLKPPSSGTLRRDATGRVTLLAVGRYRMKFSYRPQALAVQTGTFGVVHVWRFASIKVMAPGHPPYIVRNRGWVIDSRDVHWSPDGHYTPHASQTSGLLFPRAIGPRRGRVLQTSFRLEQVGDGSPSPTDSADNGLPWSSKEVASAVVKQAVLQAIDDTYEPLGKALSYYEFYHHAQQITHPSAESGADLTSADHVLAGVREVLLTGEPAGWIVDTYLQMAGLLARYGQIISNCIPPVAQSANGAAGCNPADSYDPSGDVATPSAGNMQRLGISARAAPALQ